MRRNRSRSIAGSSSSSSSSNSDVDSDSFQSPPAKRLNRGSAAGLPRLDLALITTPDRIEWDTPTTTHDTLESIMKNQTVIAKFLTEFSVALSTNLKGVAASGGSAGGAGMMSPDRVYRCHMNGYLKFASKQMMRLVDSSKGLKGIFLFENVERIAKEYCEEKGLTDVVTVSVFVKRMKVFFNTKKGVVKEHLAYILSVVDVIQAMVKKGQYDCRGDLVYSSVSHLFIWILIYIQFELYTHVYIHMFTERLGSVEGCFGRQCWGRGGGRRRREDL